MNDAHITNISSIISDLLLTFIIHADCADLGEKGGKISGKTQDH